MGLSGLLARAKQGGVFSEALSLVMDGAGVQRGAVYEATADGLSLLTEEGLPKSLAAFVRVFPSAESPWFPVQQAAKRRKVIVDGELAISVSARIDGDLLQSAGWSAIAAAPIMIGREVLGVLAIAAPTQDALTPDAIAVLETAANMLALAIAHERARELKLPDAEPEDRRGNADTRLARLAILGSIAAGFADEIRWPLSSLGNQLGEQEKLIGDLRSRFPAVGGAFEDLVRIQEEATTALKFARTAGTRLLSAIEDAPPEALDLVDLAHEATALVEPTARARHVDLLVTAIDDGKPVVIGKRGDLGQLLLAVVVNALEACAAIAKTPGKDGKEPEKPLVCVTVARDGNRIALCVEDSGPGIPPDIRPRIFEPFFSTKKDGVGLGLTLARQVVLAHGGSIEVERSELGGALVRVLLTAAPEGTQVVHPQDAPPSRRKPQGVPSPRVSLPGPGGTVEPVDSPPMTARDGWTSAPRSIKQPSKRPVRAPSAHPSSHRIGRDLDVCAPTQRVPRTPATGSPAAPITPLPAPARVQNPTPTPNTASAIVEAAVTPKVDVRVTQSQASSEIISSGRAAPTARVPEAPTRAPKSRRGGKTS